MILSMTGFAASTAEYNGQRFYIEIKSVNHRFFECRTRLPAMLSFLDLKIRGILSKTLQRGFVECLIRQPSDNSEGSSPAQSISLNERLIAEYIRLSEKIKHRFKLAGDIQITELLKLPGVIAHGEAIFEQEEAERIIGAAVEECSSLVVKAQAKEGAELASLISGYITETENRLKIIERESKETFHNTMTKLKALISQIVADYGIASDRVTTEAALMADKLDISEETERFGLHLNSLKNLLTVGGNITGRKFDFTIQELNREINTIGSKTDSKTVSTEVIEIKNLLEKVREQIQNVK